MADPPTTHRDKVSPVNHWGTGVWSSTAGRDRSSRVPEALGDWREIWRQRSKPGENAAINLRDADTAAQVVTQIGRRVYGVGRRVFENGNSAPKAVAEGGE